VSRVALGWHFVGVFTLHCITEKLMIARETQKFWENVVRIIILSGGSGGREFINLKIKPCKNIAASFSCMVWVRNSLLGVVMPVDFLCAPARADDKVNTKAGVSAEAGAQTRSHKQFSAAS
jgi:hypothetical protein